jgi:hypothetical protein
VVCPAGRIGPRHWYRHHSSWAIPCRFPRRDFEDSAAPRGLSSSLVTWYPRLKGVGYFSAVPRRRKIRRRKIRRRKIRRRKIRGRKPIAQRFHRWGSWQQSEHRVPVGTKELSLPKCVATNGHPGSRGSRGRLGGRPSAGPSRQAVFETGRSRYRLLSIHAALDAGRRPGWPSALMDGVSAYSLWRCGLWRCGSKNCLPEGTRGRVPLQCGSAIGQPTSPRCASRSERMSPDPSALKSILYVYYKLL